MILLWLKIFGYKIAKQSKIIWQNWCRIHAEAGTDSDSSRARHEDPYGLDPDSDAVWTPDISREISPKPDRYAARLRPMSGAGLAAYLALAHPHQEAVRGAAAAQQRAEQRAATCPLTADGTGCRDGSACDAEGRCAAQAILDAYDRGVRQVSESAVRPSDEIVLCPRCEHPQHGVNGGRCAVLVTGQDPEGPLMVCRCRMVSVCPLCDHPEHEQGSCEALTYDGAEHCACGEEW